MILFWCVPGGEILAAGRGRTDDGAPIVDRTSQEDVRNVHLRRRRLSRR